MDCVFFCSLASEKPLISKHNWLPTHGCIIFRDYAHALAINSLQVLNGKTLLPHRLRLTPWNSEPNHLALFSVDLSKHSLSSCYRFNAQSMFLTATVHRLSKQMWETTGCRSTLANTALILLGDIWLEGVWLEFRSSVFDSSRRQ